jgi:predicted transcriptional regulator
MSDKRPSARPLYKDIYAKFVGHTDLLGFYSMILAEVCWGDFIVHSKRKSQAAKEGEFITNMTNLTKMTNKNHRTIKRYIAILVEMGLITFEERGKQTLVITHMNIAIKTAEEASKLYPKERRDKKKDNENGPRTKLKVDNGPDSKSRKWSTDQIGAIPSSIVKEEFLKEELLKEDRDQGVVLADLKFIEANEILEAYKKRFILNVNHIERFIEKYKESNKTKEELLEGIEILYANTILRSTTTSPMRLFELNEYVLPMAKEIIGRAKSAFYNYGERNIAISSLLNDKKNITFFGNQDKATRVYNELWDKVM